MIANRRQAGMTACPITYQELEAFNSGMKVHMSVWVKSVIMRIDDLCMKVFAEKLQQDTEKPTAGTTPKIPPNTASLDDPQSLKAFMTRLTAHQNAKVAAERKGK